MCTRSGQHNNLNLTCAQWECDSFALRYSSFERSKARNKVKNCCRFSLRPNEKPVSPFLFIHLTNRSTCNYISVLFSLGMRFARFKCSVSPSLVVHNPARIAIRCSVERPTDRPATHIHSHHGRKLLCITAASSSEQWQWRVCDAICALSIWMVYFSLSAFGSSIQQSRSRNKAQNENKIDYIMRRMIYVRCESCMRC